MFDSGKEKGLDMRFGSMIFGLSLCREVWWVFVPGFMVCLFFAEKKNKLIDFGSGIQRLRSFEFWLQETCIWFVFDNGNEKSRFVTLVPGFIA